MTFERDRDGERRRKADHPAEESNESVPKKKKKGDSPEIGTALRSIYQRTVDEHIPPEMLDLLGKLG